MEYTILLVYIDVRWSDQLRSTGPDWIPVIGVTQSPMVHLVGRSRRPRSAEYANKVRMHVRRREARGMQSAPVRESCCGSSLRWIWKEITVGIELYALGVRAGRRSKREEASALFVEALLSPSSFSAPLWPHAVFVLALKFTGRQQVSRGIVGSKSLQTALLCPAARSPRGFIETRLL